MKSLKTFNLSHECITTVRQMPNQSQFVERAIFDRAAYLKTKEKKSTEFDASDMTARQLMWVLQQKDDCPSAIRAIILDIFEVK